MVISIRRIQNEIWLGSLSRQRLMALSCLGRPGERRRGAHLCVLGVGLAGRFRYLAAMLGFWRLAGRGGADTETEIEIEMNLETEIEIQRNIWR